MAALDGYLKRLRSQLRGLPDAEVAEIVAELRSHVVDSCGPGEEGVAAALRRLGRPEELAAMYLTRPASATRLASPAARPSPAGPAGTAGSAGSAGTAGSIGFLASTVRRWVRGCVVLVVVAAGLWLAGSVVIAALHKPFAPDRAGLWQPAGVPDGLSLHLGFGTEPPAGRELLGWWLVPLGLVAGAGLGWLTVRFGLRHLRTLRSIQP